MDEEESIRYQRFLEQQKAISLFIQNQTEAPIQTSSQGSTSQDLSVLIVSSIPQGCASSGTTNPMITDSPHSLPFSIPADSLPISSSNSSFAQQIAPPIPSSSVGGVKLPKIGKMTDSMTMDPSLQV